MQNPKITEKEIGIIKDAQAGDKLAFSKLFNMYKGFVDNLLYLYIKDMDEAKEITNVVFLKVYSKLSTFKAYKSFGGWLRIIAKNTAIDYLRQTENKRNILGEKEDRLPLSSIGNHADTDLVNQLTYEQLLAEFNKLPPTTRKVCRMFYKDNLTVEKISKTLSIPTGTIKSMLFRTRKRIKQQFKNL